MPLTLPHSGHTWQISLEGVNFYSITTHFGTPTFIAGDRFPLDSIRLNSKQHFCCFSYFWNSLLELLLPLLICHLPISEASSWMAQCFWYLFPCHYHCGCQSDILGKASNKDLLPYGLGWGFIRKAPKRHCFLHVFILVHSADKTFLHTAGPASVLIRLSCKKSVTYMVYSHYSLRQYYRCPHSDQIFRSCK